MNDMFSSFACAKKELRPYQTEAIRLIKQSFGKGFKRVVCQMPTGAGKTLTAAKIIEGALAKGNRVIFTAPAISLIDQTVSAFENEGLVGIGVMQANHPRTNRDAQIQVASVQTLARREIPNAALVIVDEAHIRSEAVEKMMAERSDVFFVGMSATPWAKGMGLLWQDMVIPVTIGELIAMGNLSKFSAYAPNVPDLSGVKVRAGEYAESDLEKIMSEGGIVANVIETWLAKGENRPTLCFAVNRAHAASLQREFLGAGVSAAYVDAFTDIVERQHIGRQFRNGDVRVICSVRTMTTGVDLPVSCIIDAAPTKSEMLHVQKIGRGLRVNPGTEDCVILDHAGNSLRLGLVTDIRHDTLNKSRKADKEPAPKKEKLPKECGNCAALHTGLICPFCGHERKPVAGVETADGELIEVTGKARVYTRDEKAAWWAGIQTIRLERSKSEGWAAHTYKDKFGVWPRGMSNAPGQATAEMWNFVKAKAIRYAKAQEKTRAA